MTASRSDRRLETHPLWYHSLDLGEHGRTPGWFDLAPIIDEMPWPDVRGKRCLDVGTYDGHLAFEMERRGAAEVVAIDIADHGGWDWPPDVRARGDEELARLAGPDKGAGFRLAHELLGSSVTRHELSVYDATPERLGTFDVVTCGSLLLHLREPHRALEAIRRVTDGVFVSAETIDLPLTLTHPRKPVARLHGEGALCQWWIPNARGHVQLLRSSGFDVLESSSIYSIPYGPAHPVSPRLRDRAHRAVQRVVTGRSGVPHQAVRCAPSQ